MSIAEFDRFNLVENFLGDITYNRRTATLDDRLPSISMEAGSGFPGNSCQRSFSDKKGSIGTDPSSSEGSMTGNNMLYQ